MSAYSIDTAFAELEAQVNNFEKAVYKSIEEKKTMSDKSLSVNKINRKLQDNPIAIVGMASLFAKSRNLREYWQNIINKVDGITDVPSTHWNIEEYYDPNPRTPEEKTYCKRGGFIPDVDFNPMEFGIPPSILEVTDVAQLLSLVIAKEAMEDAGYNTSREFNRETIGVILGVAGNQLGLPLAARLEYPVWEKVLKSSGLSDEDTQKIIKKIKSAYVNWDENAFPGMLGNVVAGRIANRLNLGGINCVVDAACASSLAALKMAISELVEHRCDMMLTGGVDTDNTIMAYMCFSKTPAVSPSDNVKPFDAKSDGMMLGEGIGMVVLKRLEDAVRDNDKIYAVIKGIGTSSDGRYKSIYAPRQEGQVKALQRAYDDAGFSPETITLMEAHGTGTMAGDPTEFGSLREFFGENSHKQYIALGSVKSQIGHTKAAAGAASLIKTALALHHKILPPTINVTEPNPKLNIQNSAFYLNTETRPWIRAEGEAPRRAGISSFGFGGTNYHVVLEEYEAEQERAYRIHNTPGEVLLFAQTPAQLLANCEEILGKLQSQDGNRNYVELVEESKSKDIPLNTARVGFVAASCAEACKLLQISIELLKTRTSDSSWEHPQGIYYRSSGLELTGKVVALFSGQGSQSLGMGRELVMNFPILRRLFGYMDSLLLKDNLQPVSEIVFPRPVFEEVEKNTQIVALQRTEYAQPAIGMLSAGLYKILQQAGFKADFVAGHSFGELTALWAAGVLSEEDYCFLVKARGQAMAAPQDPDYDAGAMLAVKEEVGKVEAVLKHFPRVTIANLNSPRQVVLAGPAVEIAKIRQTLQEQGYAAVLLPVSAAFHTPLIAFAQKAFAQAIKSTSFQNPKIPVYTNVTGKQYPKEAAEVSRILETHISNAVLFKQEIENIYACGGSCFVEFGPKKILTGLVKDILGDRPHLTVALNPSSQKDSDRSLREAVVQLRVAGLSLKNLDPYQLPQPIPATEKSKGLNVRLNGINYVSEKTKMAFEQALQDGHKVKLPANTSENNAHIDSKSLSATLTTITATPPTVAESNGHTNKSLLPVSEKIEDKGTEQFKIQNLESSSSPPTPPTPPTSSQPIPQPKMPKNPDEPVNYQQVLASLEYVLTQFQQNQSDSLQVHGQYLSHQMEYAKTFFQLMQQQNSLFANSKSSEEAAQLKAVLMESLERGMMQFHAQQGETLRVHEQYLNTQVEYTTNFLQLIQQEYAQVVNAEVPRTQPVVFLDETTAANKKRERLIALDTTTIKQDSSVPPTHQKPATEAQLHSVVEIGTQTQTHKATDFVSTNEFSVSPTNNLSVTSDAPSVVPLPISSPVITETVAVTTETAPTDTSTSGAPSVITETVAVATESAPTDASTTTSDISVNVADLGTNLLAIISDKTGYPVEMLDINMDMEADLGIDSIKRVEILGTMQEMYPDLPKPNVEELGELRTIGQIVECLQKTASSSVAVTSIAVETPISIQEDAKIQEQVEIENSFITLSPEFPISSPTLVSESVSVTEEAEAPDTDFTDLGQTLLAITSEKTGYPVEMLDLNMDMEADLGIDSIKRVEILGTMQEMYPNLPKPNVEELGELRTIGQIVEYLQKLVGTEKKKSLNKSSNPSGNSNNNPLRRQVKLKILPQPDFLDFTLPEGHIALLTDDGSLTTSKLAQLLTEQGWKIVVLSFPQSLVPQHSPLPSGVNRVNLVDLSEEHLQQQLAIISTQYGSIDAFIHLNPLFEVIYNGKIPYLEQEKAIVKHVFLIAKHLKKSLNETTHSGRNCFCTVTRLDGAFGLGQNVSFGPISAGLFGLTKTLNWEWQQVFCRAIDLSPQIGAEQSAQHIFAELHDPNRYITEVAYNSHERVTLISAPEI
ncbi:polyketide synthase [Brasilonema sennae CENA114]|uniref:Polyketide synthase n=1 Tax=Brasilonema sennae CENA114 TaxID=415709 RepID=A0A856MCE0_9CYAN|nr:type I polyketide synthase [Brasilonema sennae]QDL08014.1 polyketide synthase [Brasilonema sennae CENA114]